MSHTARITVRLMNRTRTVDVFAMNEVADDGTDLCLQAGSFAHALCSDLDGCPDSRDVARLAILAAIDMAPEVGFSIRSRLLPGQWLLNVRIDRRTRKLAAVETPVDYAMAA